MFVRIFAKFHRPSERIVTALDALTVTVIVPSVIAVCLMVTSGLQGLGYTIVGVCSSVSYYYSRVCRVLFWFVCVYVLCLVWTVNCFVCSSWRSSSRSCSSC